MSGEGGDPERARATPARRVPSVSRLILRDKQLFMCLVMPLALWGVFGFQAVRGDLKPHQLELFMEGGAIASLAALLAAAWRVRMLRVVFRRGVEVNGRVESVYLASLSSEALIRYSYTHGGRAFAAEEPIHRFDLERLKLGVGIPIVVLVDPKRPRRAVIRDLLR